MATNLAIDDRLIDEARAVGGHKTKVETPIWSLALRRRAPHLSAAERRHVEEWRTLVADGRVRLIGIVRQEVRSGVREARDLERPRERREAFDDVATATVDHERAAAFFHACRANGGSPGAIDVLIGAVAARQSLAILTTGRYAAILPLRLHQPSHARHA